MRLAYGFRLFSATKAPPFCSHRSRMSIAKRTPSVTRDIPCWLVATARDLLSGKALLDAEPVVRLM